jgi:hypothetical protein
LEPTLELKPGLETVYVDADSNGWRTVTLTHSFLSPVAVCTVKYDMSTSLLPAVVRMRNVASASFEIRLQNPSNAVISTRVVSCLVVEEGVWRFADGRKVEAVKYQSTITDRKASWLGQRQPNTKVDKAPVVLGQVMSYNDARWSVFWTRGTNRTAAPTSRILYTGKHVGKDKTRRVSETIGYIVMESGRAVAGGVDMEIKLGPRTVETYTHPTKFFTYAFSAPFSVLTPLVTILGQSGMSEVDGSWAVLQRADYNKMYIAVDEDQTDGSSRTHGPEMLGYAVFSITGFLPLLPLN